MNFFLAGLSVLAGVYLSYRLTSKFPRREKGLKTLYNDISKLENYVCYYQESLIIALRKIEGDYAEFFRFISQSMENCNAADIRRTWASGMEQYTAFSFLNNTDKECILDFAELLGKSDSQSQKQLFKSVKKQLEERLLESKQESSHNVRMYRILGFVAGIALAIIII